MSPQLDRMRRPTIRQSDYLLREDDEAHRLALSVRNCLRAAFDGTFDLSEAKNLAEARYASSAESNPSVAEKLNKWAHLDRMESAMLLLISTLEQKPDLAANSIVGIAAGSFGDLPLSHKQLEIIRSAAKTYTERRRKVATYRDHRLGLGNKKVLNGARYRTEVNTLLHDVGMGQELDAKRTVVDLSHPLASVIQVDEADIKTAYILAGKQNGTQVDESRADRIAGFHHNGRQVHAALLNTVCFAKSTLDSAEMAITRDHEIMHALFAILLDSDAYDLAPFDVYTFAQQATAGNGSPMEAVRSLQRRSLMTQYHADASRQEDVGKSLPNLLKLIKNLKNECAAYLWGGEFPEGDPEWLMGYKWPDIEKKLNNHELAMYLDAQFRALMRQLRRLKKAGYDTKKLSLRVLTSQSIDEAIVRLKLLG